MPFYTKVFSQNSPSAVYRIGEAELTLVPSIKENIDLAGMSMLLNSIYVFSNSSNIEDHVQIVKKWVVFHSFVTNDTYAVSLFHEGYFTHHKAIESLSEITNKFSSVEGQSDFDDIGNVIYFLNQVAERISYRSLFALMNEMSFDNFVLYLDSLGDVRVVDFDQRHLVFNRDYLKIVTNAILLEVVLGNSDSYCAEQIVCSKCGKEVPKHRLQSERDWIRSKLSFIISNKEVEDTYLKLILFAKKVRNSTVHSAAISKAQNLLQETDFEEYGYERSINEYKDSKIALRALILNLNEVTRSLLLYQYFGLRHFFHLSVLKKSIFRI